MLYRNKDFLKNKRVLTSSFIAGFIPLRKGEFHKDNQSLSVDGKNPLFACKSMAQKQHVIIMALIPLYKMLTCTNTLD